ncbi:MAG TPA: hypothetical protein VF550_20050 [Polyangia bacterium]
MVVRLCIPLVCALMGSSCNGNALRVPNAGSGGAGSGDDVATDPSGTPTATGGSGAVAETAGVGGQGGFLATGGTDWSDVAGSTGAGGGVPDSAGTTSTSILKGIFVATGSMATSRMEYTATLLPSGKVLVVGWVSTSNLLPGAELYDPGAGVFTTTSKVVVARYDLALPPGGGKIAGDPQLTTLPQPWAA